MARKNYTYVSFPLVFPTGTSAIDLVTGFTPGFRGKVTGWHISCAVAGTGTSASQTINLEINATDVPGTATAFVLASLNAIGKIQVGGVPTGGNEFSETDTISAELAASGTAFTAGSGLLTLQLEQSTRGY